jgi:hypothetical protein
MIFEKVKEFNGGVIRGLIISFPAAVLLWMSIIGWIRLVLSTF